MDRPLIAVTIGDPAGVGPEIVSRALQDRQVLAVCRPLVVGDRKVLEQAIHFCGIEMEIRAVLRPEDGEYRSGMIDLLDLDNVEMQSLKMGAIQGMCGRAAFEYIAKAVELASSRRVDAIATAPINKEALRAARVDFIGHTEILAAFTGARDPLTMFQVRTLRVFFLSRHVSLRKACEIVTSDRVLTYIQRCSDALRQLGVTEGTLAVAGLNPHSGEHGLFGNEEADQIEPAIAEAQRLGLRVAGPVPADSVFHQALEGQYSAVLSLYHDQGHIATKMVDFEKTVSLTLGLPFLRTSVDHGTAFDIAGTGKASAVSMKEAILLAASYLHSSGIS
jgi:4-phospho-D-threonate 3-dehydrogenase / 4-phospho-D-erythronate 3-dehydrogenase